MENPERNTSIEVPLYRLANEVKNEILKAMNFWQYSPIKNEILTSRAIIDLTNQYSTTKDSITDVTNNINDSDFFRVKNGIDSFKSFMENIKNNSKNTLEEERLITNLISTFEVAIESVIKK
jgi:Cu2+-containing amine oxidase